MRGSEAHRSKNLFFPCRSLRSVFFYDCCIPLRIMYLFWAGGIMPLRSTKVFFGPDQPNRGAREATVTNVAFGLFNPLRHTLLGGEWDGDFIRPTQLLKSRSLGNPGSFTSSHDNLAASVQAPTLYIRVVPGETCP
jgi:hypothetical protein